MRYVVIAILFLFPIKIFGQIISTVVGNGIYGYNSDNIDATNSRIARANAIIEDKFGNMFITDCMNNRIRKVDVNSNIITTVVGTGVAGFNGDNILAINAQINNPSANVAFDTSGNLYFTDFNNNRVRKIDITTGIITTIAGNGISGYNGDEILATSAQVYHPEGVVVSNNGNVYFADNANHRIRKVNKVTGIITTVAGNGNGGYNGDSILATNAMLYFPSNVVLDSNENIIVADWQNHRVRKINTSTGIITTIVGVGIGGIAGDGSSANLAQIGGPSGIGYDSNWNLYVACEFINRVRKVNALTNIITTVAGNGSGGYNGDNISALNATLSSPTGIATDQCNNLLIADAQNNRIRKVWFNTDTLPQVNIAVTPNDTVITGTQVTTTATVANHGNITSYQWVKNNANAGTNSAYTYTPVNGDSVYCIVTVRACTGRMYTDTTTAIHITVTGDAGVANTKNLTTQTYPNPVKDVLHVATAEPQHYVLHNLMGVTLLQGSVDKQNTIDMKAVPAGIYLLQLTNNEGQREVLRVVKE
jgi:sugar lactone lactonase YvrE